MPFLSSVLGENMTVWCDLQLKHKLGKMYILSGLAIMNYKETQISWEYIWDLLPFLKVPVSVGKRLFQELYLFFFPLSKIAIALYNNWILLVFRILKFANNNENEYFMTWRMISYSFVTLTGSPAQGSQHFTFHENFCTQKTKRTAA